MADPYIGEIRIFAGTYAPDGWLFCYGQELQAQQYAALYAVIGNTYGGKAQSTFKLPDLRGRVPMNQGQGPGLTNRVLGTAGGQTGVTLTQSQIPAHSHVPRGTWSSADSSAPANRIWAKSVGRSLYAPNVGNPAPMGAQALGPAGVETPASHDNMQPCLGINFIMAWNGVFPPKPQ